MRALSFRAILRDEAAKSPAVESRERISSQTLLDLLEVPQRNRTAGTFRRLSKVMAELGWSAVRVRDLTRGGYKEQVRGYSREPSKTRGQAGRALPSYMNVMGLGPRM
jgi:hypothetical protein